MRNAEWLKNKKVTVIGLARSGLACARLLKKLGAEISISDNKDTPAVRENSLQIQSLGAAIEIGTHTQDFIRGRDLVIISPGVVSSAPPIQWARALGIPVISEIEFAWRLCPATVIAVTGSNGKTTVTTLIGQALKKAGKRAHVCGNIGNPFTAEVERIDEGSYVVLEVSSFQLELISGFRPKVAVIINFTKNHLDRHKDMQEYLDAKKRIYMNQDSSDYLVLNRDDPVVRDLAPLAKGKVIFFSGSADYNPNQAAVIAATGALGIDRTYAIEAFTEFRGIEHRMELVSDIRGVRFIDDSKATTVDSAVWALNTLASPVILIAGGKDKGVDYRVIADAARRKVRRFILIGEAKDKIRSALSGVVPLEDAPSLQEAVRQAYAVAEPGDTVLLSPMCASFDMFNNYEERGRIFKQAVLDLAGGS